MSIAVRWKRSVGKRTTPIRHFVDHAAVRSFAEAIGDLNPLYLDEEAAAASRWGGRIAPPTYPRVFDFGTPDEIRMPPAGIIHGEQSYEYQRPLYVGEEVYCHTTLEDVYEKKGTSGRMVFVVFRRVVAEPAGEEIVASREVYILTETALAALEES